MKLAFKLSGSHCSLSRRWHHSTSTDDMPVLICWENWLSDKLCCKTSLRVLPINKWKWVTYFHANHFELSRTRKKQWLYASFDKEEICNTEKRSLGTGLITQRRNVLKTRNNSDQYVHQSGRSRDAGGLGTKELVFLCTLPLHDKMCFSIIFSFIVPFLLIRAIFTRCIILFTFWWIPIAQSVQEFPHSSQ